MFGGAQAASLFFSAACRKAHRTFTARNSCATVGVVGKLPTTTGWQPVLPRTGKALPLSHTFAWGRRLNYLSRMPADVSIPDAEDLKSRVRELRRFL
ncbi:MAG: hypothetical protein DME55_02440 [Verrucomicrobia bacterium]|nr:MAG: hypothetical protein DME55_02440 [Verrucomicrobiota bacterium]